MKSIVYVEGGGNSKALRIECRMGFRKFFGKAGLKGRMPKISACGSRQKAYKDFCHRLDKAGSREFVALLVDSEGPVAAGSGPWAHLKGRDRWDKPERATDDNAHLMVQCMEAWFLADEDALAKFFGDDFNRNSLPRRMDVEKVAQRDIARGLKMATRQCKHKGVYHKGRHSFAIIAELNPDKVTAASRHAERLVQTLRGKLCGSQFEHAEGNP